MVRSTRHHLDNVSSADTPMAPKHLTKQEFGRRVLGLMYSKGWHQSELARRAGLTRDVVSTYVNGRSIPTRLNLEKLAKTLDVEADELLPNYVESAIDEDSPSFEMKVSPVQPAVAWLRVNRLVSTATALKVGELLQSDVLPKESKK